LPKHIDEGIYKSSPVLHISLQLTRRGWGLLLDYFCMPGFPQTAAVITVEYGKEQEKADDEDEYENGRCVFRGTIHSLTVHVRN
jgi:hypothetical protein